MDIFKVGRWTAFRGKKKKKKAFAWAMQVRNVWHMAVLAPEEGSSRFPRSQFNTVAKMQLALILTAGLQ